jgi:hypothetical protein
LNLHARLNDLVSRHAKIVLLQIGALDPRHLRPSRSLRQTASNDHHRDRHDSCLFHVPLLFSFKQISPVFVAGP